MRPLPPLAHATTDDGALVVAWDPSALSATSRAAVIVALRPLTDDLADAFWAGALDTDLIRYPVDPRAGHARLQVPAGRPLALTLITRDAAGAPAAGPPLRVAPASPPAARLLEGPVTHAHAPDDHVPLVFAGAGPPPDFDALARRVAAAVSGQPSDAASPSRPPGGFGTHQRWYLTRLGWSAPACAELAAVVRDRFIAPEDIAAWRDAPPPDALPLSPDADGLVDGLCPEGATIFYAVLAGPAPWRPLALSPVPPPFSAATRPGLLGPVEDRLGAAARARLEALDDQPLALAELPPQLALLEAAVAILDSASAVRQSVEEAARRFRSAPHL